jgi:translation initiation factor IF-3
MLLQGRQNLKDKREQQPLINEKIRAPKMQLIDHEGNNVGIVSKNQALLMAQDAGLDLVILTERGKDEVPIAKIMDFGKVLYEKKKKKAEAKKHQKVIQVKEIKFRPKIGEHDYQTKMKQAIQFLKTGKRVKFTLFFRGRENILKEQKGGELFEKINNTLADNGLTDNLVQEKDAKLGKLWSRIYYLKNI